MANILLVSDESHTSSTELSSALTGLGHTVTSMIQPDLAAGELSGYDLIITTRTNSDNESLSKVIDQFNLGVPLIIGSDRGATSANDLGILSGITTSLMTDVSDATANGITFQKFEPTYHNRNYGTSGEVRRSNLTTSMFRQYVPDTSIAPGAIITEVFTDDSTQVMGAIAEAGAEDNLSGTFPAKIAIFYPTYINNTGEFRPVFLEYLSELISWMISGLTFSISGTVTDSLSAPISRVVRCYDGNGALCGKATSDAITGDYQIDHLIGGVPFTVVCSDYPTGTENALVFDQITAIGV